MNTLEEKVLGSGRKQPKLRSAKRGGGGKNRRLGSQIRKTMEEAQGKVNSEQMRPEKER